MAKETPTRILDAALDVVARQGYEATTVEAVAHRAQLTRQSLYYHFRDKRSLLAAAVQRFLELFRRRILAESFDHVLDPVEAVARCGQRLDSAELSPGVSARLSGGWVFGSLHAHADELGEDVRGHVGEVIIGWTVRVETALEVGVQQGILVPETPVAPAARLCVSSWEGAVILSRGSDDASYLADTNRMLNVFLENYRLPGTELEISPAPPSVPSSEAPLNAGISR